MSNPWEFTADDSDYDLRAGVMGGVYDPKLGTHAHKDIFDAKVSLITIEHANAKLAEWIASARTVEAVQMSTGHFYASEAGCMDKTHTAKLIMIEPIVRDTAESLLREFLACGQGSTNWGDVMNRTRKLLGDK